MALSNRAGEDPNRSAAFREGHEGSASVPDRYLQEILEAGVASGRLSFTTDRASASGAAQPVVEALGDTVFKKNITVLGAAFKPHSDDIRDSPALDVAVRPRGLGAWVTVTDPEALENAERVHPQLSYVADRDEALRGADLVLVVTEWDEYRRQLSPEHAASLTTGRIIVDGRNCLDAGAWRDAGWDYRGMGRP
ncbi:UDP binding domain-containing protein [Microbacterium sp.]|uniref:UDP binding domain-containing protein n=1 Tax=Microbacterium sp. TaxID=51671 RepID=UPI0025E5B9CE|nr:UDP binding domain-containing protein [Microbacterium sp.]